MPNLANRRTVKAAKSNFNHWAAVCKSYSRSGHIKRADLGGDGQSVPFEQALSNLAFAYLSDRAPQLVDFMLGFQLLEKSEDNDKAVGVFGFKVGEQLLYVPIFFLNGELKGHELLYLKDSDTFVPLAEEWVNYILSRKPLKLGEETSPNLRALGVNQPTMEGYRWPPSKHASAHPDWLQAGLPGLMYAKDRYIPLPAQAPLLIKESASMAMRFLQMLDARPDLAKVIATCYGADTIKCAMQMAQTLDSICPIEPTHKSRFIRGSVWTEKKAEAQQDLKIHIYNGKRPAGLTEKQAEELKRDGIYIEDARKQVSTVLPEKGVKTTAPMTLQNPDYTGLYEVLTKPNDFTKCLVINGPHGPRGKRPGCVVVRLDDGDAKAWSITHPANIFAIEHYSDGEYADWFKALPDANSLELGATYVLVCPDGAGTQVFEVENTEPSSGDEKCYRVYWHRRYEAERPTVLPPLGDRRYEYENDTDTDLVSLNCVKGSHMLARLNTLYMPSNGVKKFKIKSPDKKRDYIPCNEKGSDPPALRLGSHVDLQLGLYKMSSELKVFSNGTDAVVNGDRMPLKSALIALVKDYGLREKTARDMLKTAAKNRGETWRIKYAEPYDNTGSGGSNYELQRTGTYAPSLPPQNWSTDNMMGSQLPTTEPQEEEINIPGLRGLPMRPNMALPPDPQTVQSVGQAAQSGQKEILDTSMLANLLNGSRDDTLVDKYIPNLVKGLDSIGRLLFNFYWHYDRFEERFGKELANLEDSLRNTFENLGDLTLALKKKAIEPFPGQGTDVDLEPSAEL